MYTSVYFVCLLFLISTKWSCAAVAYPVPRADLTHAHTGQMLVTSHTRTGAAHIRPLLVGVGGFRCVRILVPFPDWRV